MAKTLVTLVLLAASLFFVGCGSEDLDTASRSKEPAEGASGVGGSVSQSSARLSDIRDAEEQGEGYPTAQAPDGRAPVFREPSPGVTTRECVTVSDEGPTRSGEVVTQVLYLNEDEKAGKLGAKMPWATLHLQNEYFARQGEVPGVVVRVASLGEPSKIKTYKFSRTAGFAEMGVSYPSYVRLPGEGPWRLIATSGPDWGCFDLKPPGRAA